MRLPALPRASGRLAAGWCLVVLVLSGCSDTRFGSELAMRPKAHAIRTAERTTLRFPQDRPFSIALPSASKQAGPDGTAQADASARADGTAQALAAVGNSGTAEGLFQLGQAFANDKEQQLDLDFSVRFHYEFAAEAKPALDLPDAVVGLKLYARDSRGRLVRDMLLVQHSTENGATEQQGDKTASFTLTLGPSESVNVFLAGQAKVDIREGRSASCSLKLSDLVIEVVTRLAPAVPADVAAGLPADHRADDEQK